MNSQADDFLRKHLNEKNAVRWPSDPSEKQDVAQTLLGIQFVSVADYWFDFARDLVSNPQPEKPYLRSWSDVAKKDRAYREAFATLNPDERQAVLRLLQHVIDGVTHSSITTLDRFPHADLVVQFVNRDDEPRYVQRVVPGENRVELHQRWPEWVKRFSSRADVDGAEG